jgi:hypothetical protein
MTGKEKVHGIVRGPFALAVADAKLEKGTILNIQVGGDPVVVVRHADGGVRAFLTSIDWNTMPTNLKLPTESTEGGSEFSSLIFSREDEGNFVRDQETGSVWDLGRGICVRGPLKGFVLQKLLVRTAFWFAWSSFFPNTEVWD